MDEVSTDTATEDCVSAKSIVPNIVASRVVLDQLLALDDD